MEVHSGDDMLVMADLGFDGLHKKVRIRLYGVDTPDAFKASGDTEAGKVRSEVRSMVLGKECYIDVHKTSLRYWIVTLHSIIDGQDVGVNQFLVDRGYIFKREPHGER